MAETVAQSLMTSVDRLAVELSHRVNSSNGAGQTTEKSIDSYVKMFEHVDAFVAEWARSIFSGRAEFDSKLEAHLKEVIRHLLDQTKAALSSGGFMDRVSFQNPSASQLCVYCVFYENRLANWFSPKLSVGPAARVKLSQAASDEIMQNIAKLPAASSSSPR